MKSFTIIINMCRYLKLYERIISQFEHLSNSFSIPPEQFQICGIRYLTKHHRFVKYNFKYMFLNCTLLYTVYIYFCDLRI